MDLKLDINYNYFKCAIIWIVKMFNLYMIKIILLLVQMHIFYIINMFLKSNFKAVLLVLDVYDS